MYNIQSLEREDHSLLVQMLLGMGGFGHVDVALAVVVHVAQLVDPLFIVHVGHLVGDVFHALGQVDSGSGGSVGGGLVELGRRGGFVLDLLLAVLSIDSVGGVL